MEDRTFRFRVLTDPVAMMRYLTAEICHLIDLLSNTQFMHASSLRRGSTYLSLPSSTFSCIAP